MAKVKIFAIWDNAIGAYGSVHDAVTEGAAIRTFSDVASNRDSALGKNPLDFSLHVLGELDTETGTISVPVVPKNLDTSTSHSINVVV